ncbi:DUF2851 family protein [Psychroflexus maritimus]|uniref:DUF2851 family protein n=1 Tax=Psychroflexus maritimus TaxID=2714865 RepID=A0A967DXI9_9FLAO|nr:DUF2851 family protein [Psychroflexus maritimus]NGZ88715.1 DUF2851 family protein [Psychroflexus maritimus]
MTEDFIHYLWKFKKFESNNAKTQQGESLEILHLGWHNQDESGPDFFNAKIKIGNQLWAGNVEIHIKSSDWYQHKHQEDSAYDNVILHVVWEDDVEVYRKDNSLVPSFQLKELANKEAQKTFENLLYQPKQFINCEFAFSDFEDFQIQSWLERVFIERLEVKSKLVLDLLASSKNNWEAVFFVLLTKNFGLNVNGESFLSLAHSFDFGILRKLASNQLALEALFLGQSHLLSKASDKAYVQKLQQEYDFLVNKYQLNNKQVVVPKFFRLRPHNFPSLRLAQLASLYAQNTDFFNVLLRLDSATEVRNLFKVELNSFWKTHYSLTKESNASSKKLSKSFIDLIIINTVVPVQFSFAKFTANAYLQQKALDLIASIKPEVNRYTKGFKKMKKTIPENALQSQALIHLKKEYCDMNKCLSCNLGTSLIGKR